MPLCENALIDEKRKMHTLMKKLCLYFNFECVARRVHTALRSSIPPMSFQILDRHYRRAFRPSTRLRRPECPAHVSSLCLLGLARRRYETSGFNHSPNEVLDSLHEFFLGIALDVASINTAVDASAQIGHDSLVVIVCQDVTHECDEFRYAVHASRHNMMDDGHRGIVGGSCKRHQRWHQQHRHCRIRSPFHRGDRESAVEPTVTDAFAMMTCRHRRWCAMRRRRGRCVLRRR
jgi:hypothetical protein